MNRRQCIGLLGAAAYGLSWPLVGSAQPGKKLTMLVGFPAGGAPDVVARAVSAGVRNHGYQAIVENKAGAGGRLATDLLLGAPADGSTVMLVPGGNLTLYPHIYTKLRYDGLKDFAPLATACEFQFALAVGPAVPASVKTLSDFVAWAKANPGRAQFGSPGAGTAMHFIGVDFAREAKFDFQHVAYRGGAPALVDAIGGTVPAVMTTLPNLVQPHKGGKVRILAHSGAQRLASVPDVPTFKEAGFPSLTISDMFLFVASAKTPAAVQKELATALASAAAAPDVKGVLEAAEYQPLSLPPEAIAARLKAEHARWATVAKATGYKSDD